MVIRLLIYGTWPTKTLAWFLAIFTIPAGGMLFYLLLGRNRKKNKFFKLKKTKVVKEYMDRVEQYYQTIGKDKAEAILEQIKKHIKLVKLTTKSSKFLPSTGNELIPLKDGLNTFNTIFKALEDAIQFIHIQYYMFEEGDLAQKFILILKRKAKDGVSIRFMYNGLGSQTLSKKYLTNLRESGIEVTSFFPVCFGSNTFKLKNHSYEYRSGTFRWWHARSSTHRGD